MDNPYPLPHCSFKVRKGKIQMSTKTKKPTFPSNSRSSTCKLYLTFHCHSCFQILLQIFVVHLIQVVFSAGDVPKQEKLSFSFPCIKM